VRRPEGLIRRLTHDEWLVLGLLGALLGLSLLLVHMPAALWAGNTGEFHWRFDAFLRPGLALLAGGLATAFLILVIVPQTMRSALASLLCAVSLVSWVYGFFLAGHMTALNGIDAPMLALYERCRSIAASGIGAARLVGHTCQGCHLTIPATEVDALRKSPPGTVAHCDNCGAILVP